MHFWPNGGISGYTVPPHTTKRRTTNLKTKNNQNCQKIKLYGTLTTKELKKKHLSRTVGGADMGHWGREDSQQGSKVVARGPEQAVAGRAGGLTFACR